MKNNPVRLTDFKGNVPCCEFAGQFWQTTQQVATSLAESSDGGENPVSDLGIVAVEIVGTVGPSLLLKVMSGDKIDLSVRYFFNSGTNGTQNSSVTDVLASYDVPQI